MSLFGTSPPDNPSMVTSTSRGRSSLFDDDEPAAGKPTTDSLFADDDYPASAASPWGMPTPRKQQSRADMIRNLLPATNVPDSYVEAFDAVVHDDGVGGRISTGGVARTLAVAKLGADDQARVLGIIAPDGATTLSRGEFNVFLALIALAQRGETVSLDTVDERRRSLPEPNLPGLTSATPAFSLPAHADLAAKPPQRPITPPKSHRSSPHQTRPIGKASMDYNDSDPWGAPDLHRDHNHHESQKTNGSNPHPNATTPLSAPPAPAAGDAPPYTSESLMSPAPIRTTSEYTTTTSGAGGGPARQGSNSMPPNPGAAWGGYFDGNNPGGFGDGSVNPNPFGGPGGGGDREPGSNPPGLSATRTIGAPRPSLPGEENIIVMLMPEKEGMFLFQHHNYEVSSIRRGSKVIRRYSDFVWLLDCLHKRFPFRALPLLPPKRVAVNGNHLSNDGAFIEKRRRGLARFLNALVRHPVLSQEQLVIMFLTVPTELSVWRKQATISVTEEFQDRELPPGLEDSLSPTLEDLFSRTRRGVKRSAELYINVCNIMDRLVKRSEGVAADHARLALALNSMTEVSAEVYATDTNEVPLLNDGLVAMSKHLRTTQSLMEDESKAWEQGVLEDLKRQRDALVSLRDMFDRRERYDRDNIPQLERRIEKNEGKLADLRNKPEDAVKPGEVEKVAQSIIADKQSIVDQHNRRVFVRECIRDELVYFQTTQYQVSRWNQDWAQERVKYAEMLADNWRRLLDELEGMPLGD